MKTTRWAKLSSRTGEDGDLCELAETDPLAALLWTWSIAAADLYGLLPGAPREYRARVAPALMVGADTIEEAIDAQVEAGLIHRYEADEKTVLYLRNYHRYQSVNWWGVHKSDYPLPKEWEVPPELERIIEDGSLKRGNRSFGRYGVVGSRFAQPPGRGRGGDNPALTPGEPRGNLGGTRRTDVQTYRQQNDVHEIRAREAEDDVETVESIPAVRVRLGQMVPEVRVVSEAWLELCGAEGKAAAAQLSALESMRINLGVDAWLYGMRAALEAEATSLKYVEKAAGSYDPRKHKPKPDNNTSRSALPKTGATWDDLEVPNGH